MLVNSQVRCMKKTNMSTERPIQISDEGFVSLQPDSLVYHHTMESKIEIPKVELPPLESLDTNLSRQLDSTLSLYEGVLPDEKLSRFKEFTERYYTSRYLRGDDLDTPELNTAREQKTAFHGEDNHFFLVTCIDGRNIPTIMFTFIPHSKGGFIRTQAGDLSAFKQQQQSGEVRLNKDSDYYKKLVSILRDYSAGTIYYGLDSHVGCAARGSMSADSGSIATDGGLYEDIVRKRKIAAELTRVAEELKESGEDVATIIPDLFSYDPHQGTMIMGLKKYVDMPDIVDPTVGFTPEVRSRLSEEGKIIDTWDLLHNPDVVQELETHVRHKADFRQDYAQSVAKNWQSLTDLYDSKNGAVYKLLMSKLEDIYGEDGKDEAELDHKAKLLMKNLVTRWSIAKNSPEWEYDTHQERVIVCTERAFGPFVDIDHFLVSSFEGDNEVIANIKTSNGLIRKFRVEKTIPDDVNDVLLIDNQAVVKDLIPDAEDAEVATLEWQKIQGVALDAFSHINWDDPETDRYKHGDIEKLWKQAVIQSGEEISYVAGSSIADGLWEVFNRMRSVMRDHTINNHLADGKTIILNTIVDQNGRPRMILPLIPHANGHHQVQ